MAIEWKGKLRLSFKGVDLGQIQMGTHQVRLESYGFFEQPGTLWEPLLLETNRSQHRTGARARLGIGERKLSLLIGFFEFALLNEAGSVLQGLSGIGCDGNIVYGQKSKQAEDWCANTPHPLPVRAVPVTTNDHWGRRGSAHP
jgi:hypothetical protein